MKRICQRIYQVVTMIFALAVLLIGCTQEATRKADWETHFTDLHFVNPQYGWIVGEKGFIIHTNNGGKTWNRQEVGTEEDPQSCLLYKPQIRLGSRGQRCRRFDR